MRFKLRRIGGVSYYPGMMRLLQALEDAGARFEMYHVGAVPPRTRRALEQRDWAVFNGDYALITARGSRALDIYLNTPHRERDRVFCARCGVRPRMPGRCYCRQCQAAYNKRSHAKRAASRIPPADMTCPRCGVRQRRVHASGRVGIYCAECTRAYTAEKNARLLERLAAGEQLFCPRCGQPRYIKNGQVYTYCHDCYAQVQRASRKRRAFARVLSTHSSGD